MRALPALARRLTGFQLRRVQHGLDPDDWKPMPTIGPGVREIRIHVAGAHRVFYVATRAEVIYVLHAFEKKTQKTAVEWQVLNVLPCSVKLLAIPRGGAARFYDFEEFARVVEMAKADSEAAYLIALLGGEAGLRCGEIMALEWADVDLAKRQLSVARSEWKGHVTATKGGRVRHVPMTGRLTEALRQSRSLKGHRVVCDRKGTPLSQKEVQVLMRRVGRKANVKPGVHILRHTFCSHLAMRGAPAKAIQELAGHQDLATTQQYMHLSPAALDAAIRLLEMGTQTSSGKSLEAAGTGSVTA